jgi:hypothetical protein
MLELKVILDFACGSCEYEMNVTVKCKGQGLLDDDHSVAVVHVACPTCGSVNKVLFEPNGIVREVTAHAGPFRLLEPSLN